MEVLFLLEQPQQQAVEPAVEVPVEVPEIVAGHVAAEVGELDGPTLPTRIKTLLIGKPLGAEMSAIITFTLFEAAYYSEIMRAGIQSIDRGQWDGARALGMTFLQAMRRIILPQALKRMTPALTNRAIAYHDLRALEHRACFTHVHVHSHPGFVREVYRRQRRPDATGRGADL